MTKKKRSTDVQRKPLQTPYMRRDSIYNPEYLDAERALTRFTPLIESLLRKMRPWYGRYDNEQDIEDLRSNIQMEFLRLHERYNPAYGVDFPGYIKMNLERRVRYFVTRSQRRYGQELLTFASDNANTSFAESVPDEKAEKDLERIDRVESVPVEDLDDAVYRDIIRQILVEGTDIYTLAARYNVSARSMASRIDAAGRYARGIMEKQNAEKEECEAAAEYGFNDLCENYGADAED